MNRVALIFILLAIYTQGFCQDFKDYINKGDKLYAKSEFNSALILIEKLRPYSQTVQRLN